ncbi:MAG: hypothetical protein ABFC96_13105 [Thermoguttaceae bacterium]
MDDRRREELLKSLQERLLEATEPGDVGSRLAWLFAHLQEYLQRWKGFADIEQVSMYAVVESDLHEVLLIGVALVDAEIKLIAAESRLRVEWDEFARIVREINGESDKDVCDRVSSRLDAVWMELEKSKAGGY